MDNPTRYKFVRESSNSKTGPMPVVIAGRDSCPPSCPLYRGGCYALTGPMAIHWKRTTKNGIDFDALCQSIEGLPSGTSWRYATAGDLPGIGDTIDGPSLRRLVKANRGRKGFTYTHKPPKGSNAKNIARANREGFTVNLSANSVEQADTYKTMGIAPVCTLIPHDEQKGPWKHTYTPMGARVVQCPAEYTDVQCATCGGANGPLCGRANRDFIVGFTTHGNAKNKAARVAKGLKILQ